MMLNFRTLSAFLTVVVIWSSTPLAIKWSNVDNGFLFAVTGRMLIGGTLCLAILFGIGGRLPLHRQAIYAYLVSGLGIFLGMLLVYRAAEDVPSGWMAVLFSLNPLFTAVLAHIFLSDEKLNFLRVSGLLIGLGGVVLVFGAGTNFSRQTVLGLGLVCVAVSIHALSSVLLRRLGSGVSPLAINTGAHAVAIPLYTMTLLLQTDWQMPTFSTQSGLALVYLGVVGSGLGFFLFYFLIQRIGASRTSIITMITPITGLLAGMALGGEQVVWTVWLGAVLLILGVGVNLIFSIRPLSRKPLTG